MPAMTSSHTPGGPVEATPPHALYLYTAPGPGGLPTRTPSTPFTRKVETAPTVVTEDPWAVETAVSSQFCCIKFFNELGDKDQGKKTPEQNELNCHHCKPATNTIDENEMTVSTHTTTGKCTQQTCTTPGKTCSA